MRVKCDRCDMVVEHQKNLEEKLRMAVEAEESFKKEIGHMIQQLSRFAITAHGRGQLAAWQHIARVAKHCWPSAPSIKGG